jgi:hypothetical protein
MRPTALWRHRGPLLQWGLSLLALAAVAVGLYVALPAEPRWEVASEPSEVFDAGDGRIGACRKVEGGIAGPVQLLDAATGREITKFLADGPTLEMPTHSPDGRLFVALVKAARPNTWHIRGVDFDEERDWQVDAPIGPCQPLMFSPRCDYLLAQASASSAEEESYVVYDTKDGRIVAQVRTPAPPPRISQFMQVSFSRDSSAFLLHFGDGKRPAFYAVNTGTSHAVTLDGGTAMALAPDARCVIADRGKEGVWVGDLADGSWRCRLEHAHADKLMQARHRFVDDLIVIGLRRLPVRGPRRLGAFRRWGLARDTGRRSVWVDLNSDRGEADGPRFSPDGRFVLWYEMGNAGQVQFVRYDVRTGEPRWRRTWTPRPGRLLFTPDSARLVVPLPDTGQVEMLDATTGVTDCTIALLPPLDEKWNFRCDGRTLTVDAVQPDEEPYWLWKTILEWLPVLPEPASMMAVRVLDLATGEWVGETAFEATGEWWLTADRRSVIAVYRDNDQTGPVRTVICCWDVPPHKPLRWIIGVPVALGGALVSLRIGWRHRPKSAAAA